MKSITRASIVGAGAAVLLLGLGATVATAQRDDPTRADAGLSAEDQQMVDTLMATEADPDSAVASLQEQAAAGWIHIHQRDVFGRIPVAIWLETETVDSVEDLGPVLALDSDELVAYFAPNVGLVTLDEFASIESHEDFRRVMLEIQGAAGCPDTPEGCSVNDNVRFR